MKNTHLYNKYIFVVSCIVLLGLPVFSQTIGNNNSKVIGSLQLMNGDSSLGETYTNSACGLNYAWGKVTLKGDRLTNDPSLSINMSTIGATQPTNITITGIPAGATFVKAFLWFSMSTKAAPVATPVTIVNPSLVSTTYSGAVIGVSGDKCWKPANWATPQYSGTASFRADVTSCITGDGNYIISGLPIDGNPYDTDGATLFIIYTEPAATFTGTLVIRDGSKVGNNSTPGYYNPSDFSNPLTNRRAIIDSFDVSVCKTPTLVKQFINVSDFQTDANGGNGMGNVVTFDRQPVFPLAEFWNFIERTMTTSNYSCGPTRVKIGVGSVQDCWNTVLTGFYAQRSGCDPCTAGSLNVPTSVTKPTGCSTSDGTATAAPTGGTTPYTYRWSNGAVSQTVTGLVNGTYTVTVYDATCNVFSTTVIVPKGELTISPGVISGSTCTGSNGVAQAGISSGGVLPYSYLWSNGSTASFLTNLGIATYTVTVSDANGCSKSGTVTIPINPVFLFVNTNKTDATCSTLGSAEVTSVTGANGPYTYSWSNGVTTQTNPNLNMGSYDVTVTAPGGCGQGTATVNIAIIGGGALTIQSSKTDASCGGSDGTATLTSVTGGTSPYSYTWSSGGFTGATGTNLSAGIYSVTVNDASNCFTSIATITIGVSGGGALTIQSSKTDASCGGSDGTATLTSVTGGTSPYAYTWSSGGFTGATGTNLSAGIYSVTVNDASNCFTSIATITIDVSGGGALTIQSSKTDASCGGSDGTAILTSVTGGTSPYSYTWSSGGFTGATGTNLSAGIYSVTVNDASNCFTSIATITIAVNGGGALTIQSSKTDASCGASDGTGTLTSVTGGTSPYAYTWSSGGFTGATGTNLSAGIYSVTVNDASNCFTSITTISIGGGSPIVLTPAVTAASCNGGDGTITVNISGAVGVKTYSWSNTTTGTTTANSILLSNLTANTYTVTVNDGGACPAIAIATVTNTGSVTAIITAPVTTIDEGQSVVLTASGATSYSWSPGVGLSCTNCAVTTATPLQTTNYCITASSGSCSDTECVLIYVNSDCSGVKEPAFIPNAFSPNNDGLNDKLCIRAGNCIVKFELNIFNRWGELVHRATDPTSCWDGKQNGTDVNVGIYAYQIVATFLNGKSTVKSGNITLMR